MARHLGESVGQGRPLWTEDCAQQDVRGVGAPLRQPLHDESRATVESHFGYVDVCVGILLGLALGDHGLFDKGAQPLRGQRSRCCASGQSYTEGRQSLSA
jgi:hypothetical protein